MKKDKGLMVRTAATIGGTLGAIVAKVGGAGKAEKPARRRRTSRRKSNRRRKVADRRG